MNIRTKKILVSALLLGIGVFVGIFKQRIKNLLEGETWKGNNED